MASAIKGPKIQKEQGVEERLPEGCGSLILDPVSSGPERRLCLLNPLRYRPSRPLRPRQCAGTRTGSCAALA